MKAFKTITCAALVLGWSAASFAQKGPSSLLQSADGQTFNTVTVRGGGPVPGVGFTTDGIQSWDGQDDADNIVVELNIGAGNALVGVSWDVGIATVGPSWLSEASVLFSNSDGSADPNGIALAPGAGQDMPGDMEFSSGGVILFADVPLADITVNADGILRLEFFEGFDDTADAVDADWRDAAVPALVNGLGLACTDQQACDEAVDPSLAQGPAIAVPTMSTFGLVALALLMMAAFWTMRRRGQI